MQQSLEEKLLCAIKKDDVKAFKAMADAKPGSRRLGRFPVLSLMYLYGACRLIKEFEGEYLKINAWDELAEPAEAAAMFAKRAGKCLRLYFDEVVSPIETLLILDKSAKVKKAYPIANPPEPVRSRLKAIYRIKYGLGVTFKGRSIALDRRPLTRAERKRVALAALGCLLIVAIIIAVPVTTTSLLPNLAKGEVYKISHIDFSSQKTYTVVRDIVVPAGFNAKEMRCTIKGGGGRLIFEKGAKIGSMRGTLSDIEIVTSGSPIFDACTNIATISRVTVNVNADVRTDSDSAFVTLTNCGIIEGVTVNVRGRVEAYTLTESDEPGEIAIGGVAAYNTYAVTPGNERVYGEIRDCTVNFEDFTLAGELNANASFGGIAGVNSGMITDCRVTGNISSDTVDVGGACYVNANRLTRVTNEANIAQTSLGAEWTPIVGGIAVENAGMIEYCKSSGDLSVTGADEAWCAGIAARTYRYTDYCAAEGNISVTAKTVYAGGIFAYSQVVENGGYVYFGTANHCVSGAKISASVPAEGGKAYVGGIGGRVDEREFEQYKRDESGGVVFDGEGRPVIVTVTWGGGVTNCVFVGSYDGAAEHFGNIAGVCGKTIYEQNSYEAGDETLVNFEGNIYAQNGRGAFGATMDMEGTLSPAEDKGATALDRAEALATSLYRDIMLAIEG